MEVLTLTSDFSSEERRIRDLFLPGLTFYMNGIKYRIITSGKPTSSSGEPKTDIYVDATDNNHNHIELKISFKKHNANFLENKTTAERAEQLLGPAWSSIISSATTRLRGEFCSRSLIFKNAGAHVQKGAITLGWKFELLNILSGALSGSIPLTRSQIIDVYSGTNLSKEKKNASVNGIRIRNSGIANYIIFEDGDIQSTQAAIDELTTINEYVHQHPDIFFACKALNYRTFDKKYDGNRPLAVYVEWFEVNGILCHRINFTRPLEKGGDFAFTGLETALNSMHVSNTDDLDETNVSAPTIIHL
jgi:hypothetical protein